MKYLYIKLNEAIKQMKYLYIKLNEAIKQMLCDLRLSNKHIIHTPLTTMAII